MGQKKQNRKLVKRFYKSHTGWKFNAMRIINWGADRPGFSELRKFSEDEMERILNELKVKGFLVIVSNNHSKVYRQKMH